MPPLTLVVTDVRKEAFVSAKTLGLVAMHEPNGTTQATGEANLAILNAYYAGGWRTHGKTLVLDGFGYGFWGTIVWPRVEGFVLMGAGVGDTRAEVEYTTYGGCVSRLVNLMPANPLFIDSGGFNFTLIGVQICGWWHATNGGLLKSEISNHARIGIRQNCGDGIVGSGKFTCSNMVVSTCEVAIQWGDTEEGDNADQWMLGRLYTPDCRVGIKSIGGQAIGSTILHYDGVRCELLHQFLMGGGDHTCLTVTLQNGSTTLLETTGQNYDSGCIKFGAVKVDGTCGASDVGIWTNHAHDSDHSPFVIIGLLHQAYGATGKLLVDLDGYCRLHIERGELIGDLEIVCRDGNSSYMHEIDLAKFRCRDASGGGSVAFDPANYVTLAGTLANPSANAYARVVMRDMCREGNVRLIKEDEYKLSRSGGVTSRVDY